MESQHHAGEIEYIVVCNDEEQYSFWPVGKKLPQGWQGCNIVGSREACLNWIKENWTDMRPRSIRETRLDVVRTSNQHHAFLELTKKLDAELHDRYGAHQNCYDPHNTIDILDTAIIGYVEGKTVACGCFKAIDPHTIEIKRMYVDPGHRRKGYALLILKEIESWACERGYCYSILETGKKQPEAMGLYHKYGYNVTPNYGPYKNMENSVCMKKELSVTAVNNQICISDDL